MRPPLLLDTSAAVPFLLRDHQDHRRVHDATIDAALGLAGHAAFETLAVLTRMPPPDRVSAATAAQLLEHNFPSTRHLSADGSAALLQRLGRAGIAGGAVYDALVAATAVEHGCRLLTRDRRAWGTYAALGVDVLVVEG